MKTNDNYYCVIILILRKFKIISFIFPYTGGGGVYNDQRKNLLKNLNVTVNSENRFYILSAIYIYSYIFI